MNQLIDYSEKEKRPLTILFSNIQLYLDNVFGPLLQDLCITSPLFAWYILELRKHRFSKENGDIDVISGNLNWTHSGFFLHKSHTVYAKYKAIGIEDIHRAAKKLELKSSSALGKSGNTIE